MRSHGVPIHFRFGTSSMSSAPDKQHDTRLRALAELLDGTSRAAEKREAWKDISERASKVLKGKCELRLPAFHPTDDI